MGSDSLVPKILVVDDDETIRATLKLQLSKLRLNADFAINGIEALNKVAKSDYKLILMDIQMPEMDGLTATSAIRKLEEDKKHKRTAIVGVTAGYADKHQCLQAGMDDYAKKPVMLEQLKRLLAKWLRDGTFQDDLIFCF